jgi:glyoxylase I family protein
MMADGAESCRGSRASRLPICGQQAKIPVLASEPGIHTWQCAARATSGGMTRANRYLRVTTECRDDFNTAEREATLGITWDDTGFHCGAWGVRYRVKDVQRAITFYTQTLGFHLDIQNLPAFGQVLIGGLKLILSGPGASGSRPMPDGRQQEPGGWNRVLLQVQDLPVRIAGLKEAGLRFRNELEVGPGDKQVKIEDPDGNPIELFEPARY